MSAFEAAEASLWSRSLDEELVRLARDMRSPSAARRRKVFAGLTGMAGVLAGHIGNVLHVRAQMMLAQGMDPEPGLDEVVRLIRKGAAINDALDRATGGDS